jgi:hypothetical protein
MMRWFPCLACSISRRHAGAGSAARQGFGLKNKEPGMLTYVGIMFNCRTVDYKKYCK